MARRKPGGGGRGGGGGGEVARVPLSRIEQLTRAQATAERQLDAYRRLTSRAGYYERSALTIVNPGDKRERTLVGRARALMTALNKAKNAEMMNRSR